MTSLSPNERRMVVPLWRIPRTLRQAVLLAEDQRFYEHRGVDAIALVRATWNDIRGRPLQGGSTITQQLAKNRYVGRERNLIRKLREAVVALRLERRYSKDELLGMYLNDVYLGHGLFGVQAAADAYFAKDVSALDVGEAATLASLIPAPARFSPWDHPEAARARRDRLLGRMAQAGMLTPSTANWFSAQPLGIEAQRLWKTAPLHFINLIRQQLAARFGERLYREGGRVDTTLDLNLQLTAEEAIEDVLKSHRRADGAFVALDVHTGGILAMVGGRHPERLRFNLATQGHRQAGSTFKPFVLAEALRKGIPADRVYPAPSSLTIGDWTVHNYGDRSFGSIDLHAAMVNSVNTVFAKLTQDVDAGAVVKMARRLGIRSQLSTNAAIGLGVSAITPMDLTTAYATLASGGVRRRPSAIADVRVGGRLIAERTGPGRRVLTREAAAAVTAALRDVVRVGTGVRANIAGVEVAGKTGTTDDHADAWFCGYTDDVAACAWVGDPQRRRPLRFEGSPMVGGSAPAEIWRRALASYLKNFVNRPQSKSEQNEEYTESISGRPSVSDVPSTQPSIDGGNRSAKPRPVPTPTPRPVPTPTPRPTSSPIPPPAPPSPSPVETASPTPEPSPLVPTPLPTPARQRLE